jgi:hypothetical protein
VNYADDFFVLPPSLSLFYGHQATSENLKAIFKLKFAIENKTCFVKKKAQFKFKFPIQTFRFTASFKNSQLINIEKPLNQAIIGHNKSQHFIDIHGRRSLAVFCN